MSGQILRACLRALSFPLDPSLIPGDEGGEIYQTPHLYACPARELPLLQPVLSASFFGVESLICSFTCPDSGSDCSLPCPDGGLDCSFPCPDGGENVSRLCLMLGEPATEELVLGEGKSPGDIADQSGFRAPGFPGGDAAGCCGLVTRRRFGRGAGGDIADQSGDQAMTSQTRTDLGGVAAAPWAVSWAPSVCDMDRESKRGQQRELRTNTESRAKGPSQQHQVERQKSFKTAQDFATVD